MTDRNKNTDVTSNRVTPREVEPDRQKPRNTAGGDRSTSHDRGLRRDPEVVEADGGDIAGVAGGGVDDRVSGLGGDKNRR
jgi:hypothetical protein